MPKFGKAVSSLLLIALTGCGTTIEKKGARAPNWESDEFASMQSRPNKPPAPTPPPPPQPHILATNNAPPSWLSLDRWCEANNQPPPLRIGATPPAYSLASTNGLFVFRSGSTIAFRDGLEVRLGFVPQVIDGHLFIHSLDFQKTVEPLIAAPALPVPTSHRVIVIDPGHGGSDPGTRTTAGNHFEKDLTLDWALRLAPLLAADGWQVFLTRTNDIDLGLSNRVTIADLHRADLFLSLHFNSSTESRQQGVETYCLTPAGVPSTITRGFQDDLLARFTNNLFDAQNVAFAYRVHSALVHATANNDRGVRRARFPGVLRNQNRPAILVEGGYLSSPHEAERILNPDYRQKLAETVAFALSGGINPAREVTERTGAPAEAPKQTSPASQPQKTAALP